MNIKSVLIPMIVLAVLAIPATAADTGYSCAAVWEPVCGSDGKTYSNDCYAKSGNVSIAYTGECKLKSNFLKTDTALKILSGEIQNYSIRDLGLQTKGDKQIKNSPMNRSTFAFRILNSLVMLGYTFDGYQDTVEEPYSVIAYKKFQKNNNLTVTETVNSETLVALDALIYEIEQRNQEDAKKFKNLFPSVDLTSEPPINEPPRTHNAALLYRGFSSLPRNIQTFGVKPVFLSLEQFMNNVVSGLYQSKYDSFYLTPECTRMKTMFHEYGHNVDYSILLPTEKKKLSPFGNVYSGPIYESDPSIGFYNISWINSTHFKYDNSTLTMKEVLDVLTQNPEKYGFVSEYAANHPVEDFAETFAAYITNGKMFREKAKTNNILQKKYDWMSNNVFSMVEYDTGTNDPSICVLDYKILPKTTTTVPIGNTCTSHMDEKGCVVTECHDSTGTTTTTTTVCPSGISPTPNATDTCTSYKNSQGCTVTKCRLTETVSCLPSEISIRLDSSDAHWRGVSGQQYDDKGDEWYVNGEPYNGRVAAYTEVGILDANKQYYLTFDFSGSGWWHMDVSATTDDVNASTDDVFRHINWTYIYYACSNKTGIVCPEDQYGKKQVPIPKKFNGKNLVLRFWAADGSGGNATFIQLKKNIKISVAKESSVIRTICPIETIEPKGKWRWSDEEGCIVTPVTGTCTSYTDSAGCIVTKCMESGMETGTITCPSKINISVPSSGAGSVPGIGGGGFVLRSTGENKGTIESGSVSAEYSGELAVEQSKIYMRTSSGKKQVVVTPEDIAAISGLLKEHVLEMKLAEQAGKPLYSVKGMKQARLLFIIPVSMEVEIDVDAETGNVVSMKKPWWSFMAAESQTASR